MISIIMLRLCSVLLFYSESSVIAIRLKIHRTFDFAKFLLRPFPRFFCHVRLVYGRCWMIVIILTYSRFEYSKSLKMKQNWICGRFFDDFSSPQAGFFSLRYICATRMQNEMSCLLLHQICNKKLRYKEPALLFVILDTLESKSPRLGLHISTFILIS